MTATIHGMAVSTPCCTFSAIERRRRRRCSGSADTGRSLSSAPLNNGVRFRGSGEENVDDGVSFLTCFVFCGDGADEDVTVDSLEDAREVAAVASDAFSTTDACFTGIVLTNELTRAKPSGIAFVATNVATDDGIQPPLNKCVH